MSNGVSMIDRKRYDCLNKILEGIRMLNIRIEGGGLMTIKRDDRKRHLSHVFLDLDKDRES